MADEPKKKKVKIVAKKRSAPQDGPDSPNRGAGSHSDTSSASSTGKTGSGGLLDISKLFDFPAGMAEGAREIWMAGIGALSTVEEAGQAVYQELVRKGEKWERESRESLRGARDQAASAAGKARSTAGSVARAPLKIASDVEAQIERIVENSVEGVLHRLGVPTRTEVQELIGRVETLTGKVDRLMERLQDRADDVGEITTVPVGSAPVVYFVSPGGSGWMVTEGEQAAEVSSHPTKAEAVRAARAHAKSNAPSTLIVLKMDGTEQDRTKYAA